MHREVTGRGFPSSATEIERRPPNQSDPNGYYHAFGLSPDATDAEVRRAYRFLARRMHPDGARPNPELFHVVQHVFSVLGDEQARHRYDTTPEGQAFLSSLEMRRLERHGVTLPPAPPAPTGWTYRTDGDLPLPDGLYEGLLARARELRVSRTWRVTVAPGAGLAASGGWIHWGADLPVTRWSLDAAISLSIPF